MVVLSLLGEDDGEIEGWVLPHFFKFHVISNFVWFHQFIGVSVITYLQISPSFSDNGIITIISISSRIHFPSLTHPIRTPFLSLHQPSRTPFSSLPYVIDYTRKCVNFPTVAHTPRTPTHADGRRAHSRRGYKIGDDEKNFDKSFGGTNNDGGLPPQSSAPIPQQSRELSQVTDSGDASKCVISSSSPNAHRKETPIHADGGLPPQSSAPTPQQSRELSQVTDSGETRKCGISSSSPDARRKEIEMSSTPGGLGPQSRPPRPQQRPKPSRVTEIVETSKRGNTSSSPDAPRKGIEISPTHADGSLGPQSRPPRPQQRPKPFRVTEIVETSKRGNSSSSPDAPRKEIEMSPTHADRGPRPQQRPEPSHVIDCGEDIEMGDAFHVGFRIGMNEGFVAGYEIGYESGARTKPRAGPGIEPGAKDRFRCGFGAGFGAGFQAGFQAGVEEREEAKALAWRRRWPFPEAWRYCMWPALYLLVVVLFRIIVQDFGNREALERHKFVLAVYIAVQTITSVGYGDFPPQTPLAKLWTCVVILFVNGAVGFWGDLLLECICGKLLKGVRRALLYFGIHEQAFPHLMSRIKIMAAIVSPLVLVLIGAGVLCRLESLKFWTCVYFCIISMSTVGFGDIKMQTIGGRIFGSIWLGISTSVFAKCCSYLCSRIAQEWFGIE